MEKSNKNLVCTTEWSQYLKLLKGVNCELTHTTYIKVFLSLAKNLIWGLHQSITYYSIFSPKITEKLQNKENNYCKSHVKAYIMIILNIGLYYQGYYPLNVELSDR